MITVTESGMEFGPFDVDNLFYVEKSPYVANMRGIKACEFVLWVEQQGELIFIEAKSSVPNPTASPEKYKDYFIEMLEKFDNSLQLLAAGTKSRSKELAAELGAGIANLDWQNSQILFYLVIPKAPDQFLDGLTSKLRQSLDRQLKIWRAEAFVINERLARSKGLLRVAA